MHRGDSGGRSSGHFLTPTVVGRELGREGLEAFHETRHVHIDTVIELKAWWYPYGGSSATA